ncbi:MAG: ATP-binding cassette domain-containing protein, partial [Deltaproteobacteria bacterium]
MNQPVLEIINLSISFGGLQALKDIDLTVQPSDIIAIIGPNGAGKTTFFNCLTGIYTPNAGEIYLTPDGRDRRSLKGLKPNQITGHGIARTFQNIRLFPDMTALENVMIGCHCRARAGILGAILRGPKTRREEQ